MTEALRPLAFPAFRLVFAARITAMSGSALAPIALAFAVLDLTGSLASLGVVVGARSAMNVAFLLWGGVVADRVRRQYVLVGSSALSALSQGVIALLVLSGSMTMPVFVALSAFNGIVSAFAFPASAALIPQTVPDDQRQQANALLSLGMNAVTILSTSLGGLLVAFVSPGWGLAVGALAYALGGVCFAFVRVPNAHAPARHRDGVLAGLKDGWAEFTSRTWVWLVVVAFLFINAVITGSVMILGPAVAGAADGRESWGFALAAQTVGMVIGATIALRARFNRLLLVGVASVGLEAGLPLALAVRPTTLWLIAAAFACGVALEIFGVAWETSLQQHVPSDRLARVYSYDALGSFIALPVAQVAVGPVAQTIGVSETLLLSAGIVIVATVVMLASSSVRNVKQVVPEEV